MELLTVLGVLLKVLAAAVGGVVYGAAAFLGFIFVLMVAMAIGGGEHNRLMDIAGIAYLVGVVAAPLLYFLG